MEEEGREGTGCKGVLVVEDDCALREMVVILIEAELDVQVREAEDGDAALVVLARETPCLVVTDMGMPHMDGTELVRRLRDTAATAHLAVLVVSASASATKEAMAAGADDYLQKPFDVEDLMVKIRRHLACIGCS